ncbi:MAG: type II toxin-antitoxin system Phd/YefM family antitoxin [Stenotrophomonas sp.]|jgi:prevent-host-death family protein|uniref:type II toxin-antitoxin system Phd/YefM family antitoxin n=1 Tax=unclassified Stenotrophomonas TaxID=196198 RepID=UPI003BA0D96F
MLHALKFDPITELTRTTASAVKEHWRKVMQDVRERQMVLVTNHNEPQAVIISAEQYQALQAQVVDLQRNLASLREQAPALQQLRDSFDARLSSLDEAGAGRKARALLRKPARLKGKVQAGTGY